MKYLILIFIEANIYRIRLFSVIYSRSQKNVQISSTDENAWVHMLKVFQYKVETSKSKV